MISLVRQSCPVGRLSIGALPFKTLNFPAISLTFIKRSNDHRFLHTTSSLNSSDATPKTGAQTWLENKSAINAAPSSPITKSHQAEEDLDGIYVVPHFRHGDAPTDWRLPHPVWSPDELSSQVSPHHSPKGIIDALAFATVKTLRVAFDVLTGYTFGFRNEQCYLRRVIFLETVAGVPGMVGAMSRHLSSLRSMERDCGWIHTLLEEAENERMHLMIAMCLRNPSFMIRLSVLLAQGGFLTWYTLMYAISSKYCHRFVGYLEEEAFKTYTSLVEDLDAGELPGFKGIAPSSVQKYYRLGEQGTLRDVFLAMRADENHHREVNHTFANVGRKGINPFPPGY